MSRAHQFLAWAAGTFGPIALNQHERTMRFLEETIELAHATHIEREDVERIVARVFDRRRGIGGQELAQSIVTLEMLVEFLGLDWESLAQGEFERVKAIPREEWERRHAAKKALGIAS